MSKNKHRSSKFNDRMDNVLDLFQPQSDYFRQLGIHETDHIFTADELEGKPNNELVQYLYSQISKLSRTNTTELMQRENNRGVNFGQTTEDIEARIEQCTTEIEKRFNAAPYNRTEGRMLDYAMNIINGYKDAQNVMEKMASPFNFTVERNIASNANVDYEPAHNALNRAVNGINEIVASDFDETILSEEVKAAMNGGELTPESLVDVADLDGFQAEIEKQIVLEQETHRVMQNRLQHEYEEAETAFNSKINGLKEKYKNIVTEENARHTKAAEELQQRFFRTQMAQVSRVNDETVNKFNEGLSKINSEEFRKVSDKFRMNSDEILGSNDVEALQEKNNAYSAEIRNLNEDQAVLDLDISQAQRSYDVEKEYYDQYDRERNVEDSPIYKADTEQIKEHEQQLEQAEKVLSEVAYSVGIEGLTPEFLKENKLNYTMPSTAERDKAIEAARKTVYGKIGKGKFKWTDEGRNLNKAAADLHDILANDFEKLGLKKEIDNYLEDYNIDTYLDAEQSEANVEANAEGKPYRLPDSLKGSYETILGSLNANNDPQKGFESFGTLSPKTGKQEMLLINDLIYHKDALKEFVSSINPALEGDPEKQALLTNMKAKLENAVKAIEAVDKIPAVKDTVLNLATSIIPPTDEEAEIKDKIQEELTARRDKIEKNLNYTKNSLEKYVEDYPNRLAKAQKKVEEAAAKLDNLKNKKAQNSLDIEYLNNAKEIINGHVANLNLTKRKEDSVVEQENIKKQTADEIAAHESKMQAIKTDMKNEIGPVNDKGKEDLAKLKDEHVKTLQANELKIAKLRTLSEKIKDLNTAKKQFERLAPGLADAHHTLKEHRDAAIDNLTADHVKDLKKIDERIRTALETMANTKRTFGNSDEFNEMVKWIRGSVLAEGAEPDVNQTAYQYSMSVNRAKNAIDDYTTLRDKNAGHKKTDVGQIRLDNAYRIKRLFEVRERMITNYLTAKRDLNNCTPEKVEITTKAEEVLFNKLELKPELNVRIRENVNTRERSKTIDKTINVQKNDKSKVNEQEEPEKVDREIENPEKKGPQLLGPM